MNILSKINDILTLKERRQGFMLLCMLVLMAFFDVIGVASIMPFIAVLSKPELIGSNHYLNLVHTYLGSPDKNYFQVFLGFVFFVCLLVSVGFKALGTWFLMHFTYMCQYSLSKRIVHGYLHQPYAWFLNRNSSDLGKTVLSEVDQVIAETLVPLLNFIAQGVLVIALLALIMIVDPILAVAAMVFFLVAYGGFYILLRNHLSRGGADNINSNRMRFSILAEAFGGIKDIKLNGLEDFFVARFEGPAYRFSNGKAFSQATSQLPRFALEVLVFGGILLLVFVLIKNTGRFDEAIPVVTLYAFAGYRLIPAMQKIYASLTTLRFSHHAFNNLHMEIMVLHQSCKAASQSAQVELKHVIGLENIFYTYPQAGSPALKSINIDIPVHATVGFVGTTGSGKTTLADVILGLLEPQCGKLLIDGVVVNRENLSAWQKKIGYVPQVIYLSDDTVAANIAFGIPVAQVDQTALERAARIANLHDFVCSALPHGYNTRVGERGIRLSGGQRQRIGIARALYRNPEVLILDEATSALGNITEHAVMEAMHNLSHQVTIILIAHRLSTIKECDVIFMLAKGELVGQGRYEDLVATNNGFNKLVNPSAH